MFFDLELLCKKSGGKFAAIWIAATRGVNFLTKKELESVIITTTCEDIMKMINTESRRPNSRMSLRLSANLLCGTVRIHHWQVELLYRSIGSFLSTVRTTHLPLKVPTVEYDDSGSPVVKAKTTHRKRKTVLTPIESDVAVVDVSIKIPRTDEERRRPDESIEVEEEIRPRAAIEDITLHPSVHEPIEVAPMTVEDISHLTKTQVPVPVPEATIPPVQVPEIRELVQSPPRPPLERIEVVEEQEVARTPLQRPVFVKPTVPTKKSKAFVVLKKGKTRVIDIPNERIGECFDIEEFENRVPIPDFSEDLDIPDILHEHRRPSLRAGSSISASASTLQGSQHSEKSPAPVYAQIETPEEQRRRRRTSVTPQPVDTRTQLSVIAETSAFPEQSVLRETFEESFAPAALIQESVPVRVVSVPRFETSPEPQAQSEQEKRDRDIKKHVERVIKSWNYEERRLFIDDTCPAPVNRYHISVIFGHLLHCCKRRYVILNSQPDSCELGHIELGPVPFGSGSEKR